MSEDSFSDTYYEFFANELEPPELNQQENKTYAVEKLNRNNDIEDFFIQGNKNPIEQINSLNRQQGLSSYKFNNLYNGEFNNQRSNQSFQNVAKFTEDHLRNTNSLLTKNIPWSVLPNKTSDSSNNIQSSNNDTKLVTLIYATKTDFLLCSISINHDGTVFVYSDGSNVYFVSLQNGAHMYSVPLPGNREIQTRALCFSKDSKYLATSVYNGKIAIISNKSVQAVLSKHTNSVTALSFTDEYLISGGLDGNLIIWKINSQDGNNFSQMPKSNNYAQGEMSSSSSTSSSGDSSLFSIHKEIQYQSVISIDICQNNSIVAIGSSNSNVGIFDGKSILCEAEKDIENEKEDFSSSSSTNQENDAQINSTHSFDNLNSITGRYSDSTTSSPDSSDSPSFEQNQTKLNEHSNSSENSNQTKLNKKIEKIKSFEVHQKPLLGVAISNKNNLIATCSRDKTAKIWDISELSNNIRDENSSSSNLQNILQTQPPLLRSTLESHDDFVTSVTFSPIDNILFTGSKDEKIKAWNTTNGELLFTINAHQNTVFDIKHHPSKRIFVSCSGDGLICVWNYISTGQ